MRSNDNQPNPNSLARLCLALVAFATVFAFVTAADAAQRGGMGAVGPVGGFSAAKAATPSAGGRINSIGIIGNPGGIIARPVSVGGNRTGSDDRPRKPAWRPPVIVTVPPTIAASTPVTLGVASPGGGPGSSNSGSNPSRLVNGVPPAGERRYVPDEVLVQLASSVPNATVEALARRLRLDQVEFFDSNGTTMFRWKIPDRRSVPEVIRALQGDSNVQAAQPNYLYQLQQQQASIAESALEQYALGKLRLPQAHELAKGEKVLVAVIDSGVDMTHPELAGVIVESFDALGFDEKVHSHGTAVAGAIVAHARLTGVAPAARILAARAFSVKERTAEATTYSINKSIDWALGRGARVINMSFTGPRDPAIEHRVATAAKQGIILIAAAGNNGPKAPEAFPAAYPSVIAVTATDPDDRLFTNANRGRYVTVAAPGVDLLLPAPGAGYQLTTGTSFAAAEVSGIVALMLERKPELRYEGVRKALITTAHDLGPKGVDPLFGAGLVDAYEAVRSLAGVIATTGAQGDHATVAQ